MITKLKHVIYVDQKKVNTEGYSAELSIHSMEAVQELGSLQENSAYISELLWVCFLSKFKGGKKQPSHIQYHTTVALSCSGKANCEAPAF